MLDDSISYAYGLTVITSMSNIVYFVSSNLTSSDLYAGAYNFTSMTQIYSLGSTCTSTPTL